MFYVYHCKRHTETKDAFHSPMMTGKGVKKPFYEDQKPAYVEDLP